MREEWQTVEVAARTVRVREFVIETEGVAEEWNHYLDVDLQVGDEIRVTVTRVER